MPETVPAGDPRHLDPQPGDTLETRSDPELIAATRGGDTTAYAVLYERHIHSARRLSRILSRDPAGADDLVSETFAKLLHTFREGGGPDLAEGAGDGHQRHPQQHDRDDARDRHDQRGQLGGGHGRLRSMRVRISCSKPWGDGS